MKEYAYASLTTSWRTETSSIIGEHIASDWIKNPFLSTW